MDSMAWEEGQLSLIDKLEREKIPKAQQRAVAARRGLDTLVQQLNALRLGLEIGRTEFGLLKIDAPDPDRVAEYGGMGAKGMLRHWADTHNGEVVMNETVKFLAAAGVFRDKMQAAGTLYPTVTRLDDFEKVARGIYRRRVQADPPVREASTNGRGYSSLEPDPFPDEVDLKELEEPEDPEPDLSTLVR